MNEESGQTVDRGRGRNEAKKKMNGADSHYWPALGCCFSLRTNVFIKKVTRVGGQVTSIGLGKVGTHMATTWLLSS